MINPIGTQADSSGGLTQGGSSASERRNAWLLQLESAWLALDGNRPNNMKASDGAAPASAANEGAGAAAGRVAGWHSGSAVATHAQDARIAAEKPAGSDRSQSSSSNISSEDDEASGRASASDTRRSDEDVSSSARSKPGSTPAAMASQTNLHRMGEAGANTDGMPVSLIGNRYGIVAGLDSAVSGQAEQMQAISSDTALAAPIGIASAPAASVGPVTLQLPSSIAGQSAATMASAEEANTDEPPGSRRTQRAEAGDESFASRHLHVFQDDEGIRAWIRDTSLSSADASAVARGLRQEFGVSSLPLTALMINGKPVELASNPFHNDGFLEFMPGTGEEKGGGTVADPSKSIIRTKERGQHGN